MQSALIRIKETVVVVADPDRSTDQPNVMPTHEDASKESILDQTEPGGPSSVAGSQQKISRGHEHLASANFSSSLKLSEFTNGNQERKEITKGDFHSIPCRDVHEKLFRDFFELVLQQAIFQVSSLKLTDLCIHVCQRNIS